jgi:hypothetical protein
MKEESKNSKKKNHNSKNSKKIIINTKEDLSKLSFTTLKNAKIFDFEGEYYDFIYNRALGIEKNPPEKDSLLTSNDFLVNKQISPKPQLKASKTAKTIKTTKKVIKKTVNNSNTSSSKKKEEKKNIINNNNSNNNKSINSSVNNNNYSGYFFNHQNYGNDVNIDYTNQSLPLPSIKFNKEMGIQLLKKQLKIDYVVFQMKYNTCPGEDLGVIGSIEELGMWDQNKALKLGWNTGNVWKTKINYNFSRNNSFEFKFIFISNGRVKQWEDGSNRKLNYVQLKELIEHNMKEGYLVTLNNINGNDITYNHKDCTLTVSCDWNKK